MPSAARPVVAVCVATFRRPLSLGALLESLSSLRFEKAAAPALRFVVVDNDEAGSAQDVVRQWSAALGGPVTYEVEPKRNISAARNTAVRIALAHGAELVAFVDDDEWVPPQWLDEMLAVQQRLGADAVCGPVLPRYEPSMPAWIVRADLFTQRRLATGTVLDWGQTGNSLIAASALAGPEPFDLRFGVTGAEDTQFFLRLRRGGGVVVWCDEAAIEESVPVSRGTMGWIVRRAFRVGNNYVFCERSLPRRREWVVRRLANAVGRVAVGSVLALPSLFLGRAALARSLRIAAHGAGTLAGLAGIRYEEYRVLHGR